VPDSWKGTEREANFHPGALDLLNGHKNFEFIIE